MHVEGDERSLKVGGEVLWVEMRELVARVLMLEVTGCMPWEQITNTDGSHLIRLMQLAGTLQSIDRYINN